MPRLDLQVGGFEAAIGGCSVCKKQDILVATEDYYTVCAACLRRVADALDKLKSVMDSESGNTS